MSAFCMLAWRPCRSGSWLGPDPAPVRRLPSRRRPPGPPAARRRRRRRRLAPAWATASAARTRHDASRPGHRRPEAAPT